MENPAKEIPPSESEIKRLFSVPTIRTTSQPRKRIIVKLLNAINGFGVANILEDPNETVDDFIKKAKVEFGKLAENCDSLMQMPYHIKLKNFDKMYDLVNDFDMVLLYEKDSFDNPEKEVIAIVGEKIRNNLNYDYLKFLSYKELIEISWYNPQELSKILKFNEEQAMDLKVACLKEIETRQRNRIMS